MTTIKIHVFTKYANNGASSRYRHYNYVHCFSENAINVDIKPLFSVNYLNTNNTILKIILVITAYIRRFLLLLKSLIFPKSNDLIIIEYELFPYLSSFFERILKLQKIPHIVDYDDAIFHRYDKNKNPILRFLLKNKISKVMKYASAVIVGNDYLQSYAQNYNNRILQLPTVVLLDKYEEAIKQHKLESQESPFVIGWIGSKTTSPYVLDILPTIQKFVNLYKAECHLIGFDETLLTPEMLKKCKITIVPWSENTEIQEMLDCDIGIMPLTDDAWSKGKCGFKLIQYMSCKKPVVASPVGVNESIVEGGINGYLATSNEQWFAALERLYNNKDLRKSMSENNWQKILENYNYRLNCEKYVALIKDVVDMG